MNYFKQAIKNYLLSKRIERHQANLACKCLLGKEFNAASWQKKSGILNFSVTNHSGDPERVSIGDYCNLDASINCERHGRVHIGNHVFMNTKTIIRCDHEISVGNYCMFGPNVKLWDTKNHPMSISKRERQARGIYQKPVDSYESGGAPIIIEDNVWLCMDVTVLSGVRIGYGSVVAAGSVVTKEIPPKSFAAGIPAKVIGDVPD